MYALRWETSIVLHSERLLTMVKPRRTSRMFHRSTITADPTVRNMKRPTILQLIVKARKTPVATSQAHHACVNSLRIGQARAASQCHSWTKERGNGAKTNPPMTQLVEADVAVEGYCLEEDHGRVEEDQPGLRDVRIVCGWQRGMSAGEGKEVVRAAGKRHAPKHRSIAVRMPMMRGYPLSLMMPYRTGGVRLPRMAGRVRMPT